MSEPQSDALTTSPQPPKYQVKIKKCLETESNCRHMELQSIALPTELSRHYLNFYIKKWRSRRESNPRSPAWQAGVITATPRDLVLKIAGDGFEPSTFGLWAQRAARLLHPAIIKMEEERGFEPLRAFTLLSVFKTDPFSRTWVFLLKNGGLCRTRTCDRSVMSR